MGKYRYELVVVFFLLGGDMDFVVFVCIKNLEDLQLGLVVCCFVEGVDGFVGCKMISKYVFLGVLRVEDYWFVSFCQVGYFGFDYFFVYV